MSKPPSEPLPAPLTLAHKRAAVDAIRTVLGQELAGLEAVAALSRDEVQSDESRQEGKYDTRATEASYLARGQAVRIAALRTLRNWFEILDPGAPTDGVVEVGVLVALSGPREQLVFVAPQGGPSAVVDGHRVQVISPTSPLGAAMEELEAGDAFEVDTPRGVQEWEIVGLR